ncbi:hypothetical protein MMAN_00130 [Mycobacterium mantenii]|uniref:HTH cro/C1-type domain-containing protein n=1 Tax=Mycobacterium mantenii TaxID=560555 RepID=A0ABM7JM01_MYCNT|nr:hypothetical protein [Mycobacterium mantenii]BBY35879.1 hypothetical protein MMAN_00130 [Mycobacterium mantenii]
MTAAEGPVPTVAEVLGRTAKALRGDRKVELVAHAAKSAGLNWGTGRIADLEAGRVSPTLPTLYALCVAFGILLDRPLTLADLFAGDGRVRITADGATMELSELRDMLAGQPVDYGPHQILSRLVFAGATAAAEQFDVAAGEAFSAAGVEMPDLVRRTGLHQHPVPQIVRQNLLEADYRMLRSLGLKLDEDGVLDEAVRAMADRWGRSFTAERPPSRP